MVSKLTLEYDGSGFAGWVRQPGLRTVQSEVESALRTILGERGSDGRPLTLTVAGRTDSGVHAWGQVASYAHEAVDPMRVNGLLADDVAILSAEPARSDFDARRDAISRTYCYRVLARRARSAWERGRSLWWAGALDREALDECASALVGKHDFRAFTPSETEHSRFERTILRAHWKTTAASPCCDLGAGAPAGDGLLLECWIEADTFMRHMSRVLVGTMLDVAAGAIAPEQFRRLLEGRPRVEAGKTAPAHGLALAGVRYT